MKIISKACLMIVIILSLVSCNTPFLQAPTATSTQTATPSRTPTPASTLTSTPVPTKIATTTSAPFFALERQVVEEGGFSFLVPVGYDVETSGRQAFISDVEGTLIISLVGGTSSQSSEEVIDQFLTELARTGTGEFIKGSSNTITVKDIEGPSFDLTGSLFGSSLQGKTFVVSIEPNRFFYAIGISNTATDKDRWENHGSKVFGEIIESIEFINPQAGETCPVSTDITYGYTEGNAIRVGDGGDFFGGPAREKAYLDNLRGPNGETITYERTGSVNFEDTILDIYIIRGLDKQTTLYLDFYRFEELNAPVGFTCVGPFTLQP